MRRVCSMGWCRQGVQTGMHAAQQRWQGEPQRNPLILSAQVPGSRPGSACVTMIKHQWLGWAGVGVHVCRCTCVRAVLNVWGTALQAASMQPTFLSLPPLATSGAALLMPTANSAFRVCPSSTKSATDCCLLLVLCRARQSRGGAHRRAGEVLSAAGSGPGSLPRALAAPPPLACNPSCPPPVLPHCLHPSCACQHPP